MHFLHRNSQQNYHSQPSHAEVLKILSFEMGFSFWVFVLWVLLCGVGIGESDDDSKNYITWDDLSLGNSGLDLRDEGEGEEDIVIVVDQNGGGDVKTVQDAVHRVPEFNSRRVKIHILPGIYREKVYIPASKPFISFIGDPDQPYKTVITWHDKASDKDSNGNRMGTYRSASVAVESDYFCASGITFENTVVVPAGGGDGYQAVALRTSGDKSVFYKVRFLGSQDTLLDESGTHYFFQCFIQGVTDFIFGNARSLYKECRISVPGAGYAIAAQKRNYANEDTGYSFLNCTVSGSASVYLGRAWGDYSRIVYAYTDLDINVMPGGWQDWGVPSRHNTVVYGEYQCRGRGADRSGRVPWSKALNYMEARPFLDSAFINGEQWLKL